MSKTKQVIVIRRGDINMRRGKEIAQGCHASLGVLFTEGMYHDSHVSDNGKFVLHLDKELKDWLQGSFTKICVYVNSEKELLDLRDKCIEKSHRHYLIRDNGLTEFKEPTYTALAIGPLFAEKFIGLTDHLPLL